MGLLAGNRSGKRVAFVLGNGGYQTAPLLQTPPNDAAQMTIALDRLGFETISLTDGTSAAISNKFKEFESLASNASIGLLYYSGHGLQIDGTNYIVPIESDIDNNKFIEGLISIQDLTSRTTEKAEISLVFLDACRDNPFEENVNAEIARDAVGKGMPKPPPKRINPGLAFSSASAQQFAGQAFLAYAAAPGKVAWQGTGTSSIFTEGLLANIETTDLSINNLMLRVARYVQDKTSSQQEPWTSSSLLVPFYFSAGSLLWFSANLIGLSAFLVSILTLCLVVADRPGSEYVVPVVAAMFGALVFFLRGLGRAYDFMRGEIKPTSRVNWPRSMIGGYFGGILAAPIIAVSYYYSWDKTQDYHWAPFGQVLSEITLAAILTGVVLGACSIVAKNPQWFARPSTKFARYWLLLGGIAGGLLAGVLVGPPITWYFGIQSRPPATPATLLPGGLLGTAGIVFATLSYSFERTNYRKLGRNAVVSVLATLFVSLVSAIGFYAFSLAFEQLVLSALYNTSVANLVETGLILGPLVGGILGLTVGLALLFVTDD
ncbi:caspase family protein [Mesorhizobium sp. M1322]|uniref:caspase family protein n=1 Tax=Mesorhizobium sp. M1322 TaxID=2957081 RepID=UPI00333941B6